MLDNLNVRVYKSLVRSAPPNMRLKMLRELSRVIHNVENTERVIRRRIRLGVPKRSVIGRRMAAARARRLHRQRRPGTRKPSPSNLFSRLSI
jgi:hypothetical protein